MAPWSLDEDELLKSLVKTCVNHCGKPMWAAISEKIETRNNQECRCRWKRLQDGEKCKLLGKCKNKCSICGMPRRGHSCPGPIGNRRSVKCHANGHIIVESLDSRQNTSTDRKVQLQAFSTFENVYGDVKFEFLI